VKSEYRRHAEQLDLKFHPAGDGTTFTSILNEYGKDGEVLGLVVGYTGEASSDIHQVADLVAARLASTHLEYVRTTLSVAKALHIQRIYRDWGHSFARGFARVVLERARDSLDSFLNSCQTDERDADAEFNYFYPPGNGHL
jgi:hypothetical protein